MPCAVCVRNWIMEYCAPHPFPQISHSCPKSIPITCLMENWQAENRSNSNRLMDTHMCVCVKIWNVIMEKIYSITKSFFIRRPIRRYQSSLFLFVVVWVSLFDRFFIVHVYAVDYGIFASILISVSDGTIYVYWVVAAGHLLTKKYCQIGLPNEKNSCILPDTHLH